MTIILFLSMLVCQDDYSRSLFKHWTDADGDGINTRHEALIEENLGSLLMDGNQVKKGAWFCEYSGKIITDPRKLDLDHRVPLKNAWVSGACNWTDKKREVYANFLDDPDHLVAVYLSENRKKGAKGPSGYWPPAADEHPEIGVWYALAWVGVKANWELCETPEDIGALKNKLAETGLPTELVDVLEICNE